VQADENWQCNTHKILLGGEWTAIYHQKCYDKPNTIKSTVTASGVPRNFVQQVVKQIQLRTEDRENGDLGGGSPQSGDLEAAVIWYKKFHFRW